MKTRRFGLVLAAWIMGMAAASVAGTTEVMDDFNDGVRNKALWRVQTGNTTLLREQGGKLCYVMASTNFGLAKWEWKEAYVLMDHDSLDCVFTLRMPLELSQSGQSARFGVGFKDDTYPARYAGISLLQMSSTRWFAVDKSNGSTSWLAVGVARKYPETAMLRLRYSNRYKTVSFSWKKLADAAWQKAADPIDVNALWGPASQRTLRPYVYGVSSGAVVPATWFQMDNFTIINKIPDL